MKWPFSKRKPRIILVNHLDVQDHEAQRIDEAFPDDIIVRHEATGFPPVCILENK